MNIKKPIKQIPYGKSDFSEFSQRNLYLVDKTRYIRDIEEKGFFLFLIRPRRFGKSLFLSTLEAYYDILQKDEFDTLFTGTAIHDDPTPERNSYMIFKLNFSMVNCENISVKEAFLNYVKETTVDFIFKYRTLLEVQPETAQKALYARNTASEVMVTFLNYCKRKQYSLYVIIDEYDNFANSILSSSGTQNYLDITRGEGFLRSFFNVIKGGTSDLGAPISRVFMTGVSPITLDDVTSGFNIATNISLHSDINEIMGFTVKEVETMIEYYQQTKTFRHSTPELMEILGRWYNHYRFSHFATSDMFNTSHVLYFLKEYMVDSQIPMNLVDSNTRIDYNKLRQLIIIDKEGALETNGNFSKLQQIMETSTVHSNIKDSFPIDELTLPSNFISLLYYFGLLTIQGIDDENTPILTIPNESVKQLYYDYISKTYDETGVLSINMDKYNELVKGMAYRGNWQEPILYIADRMKESLRIRDLMAGEKARQVFWNVYLGLSTFYCVYSEKELNQGFADLVLEPVLANNPGIKFAYIIELKYIKPTDYEKENGPIQLETLRLEAENQLNHYCQDEKFKKAIGQTTLKKLILIFSGNLLVHHSEM